MCGKITELTEDHHEYKKLSEKISEKGTAVSYICDMCAYKIRHESEDKYKEKKPM